MMAGLFKHSKLYNEKKKRKEFCNNEIFFDMCYILSQTRYSSKLRYYFFQRRLSFFFSTKFKNRCLTTNSSKVINKKLSLSRVKLSQNISSGYVAGYFHSI